MTDTNRTSNCNMHEALVSYLYDEATPEETRRVESHLKQCSACGEELAAFERVRHMLQHWQLDDMPIVRITPPAERRSALALLKELFTIAPVWVKAMGVLTAAMLILAIIGADISIGRDGFRMQAHLPGRDKNRPEDRTIARNDSEQPKPANGMNESQIKEMVSRMILESERKRGEELEQQLVRLESGLKNSHSADVAKLTARVQEQHERINTLEHDIDRREGLGDLTDILFSESGSQRNRPRTPPDGEGGQ
ncbi:MAG TPA: zf-HC2 domain-containing protein [Blastocatellia bacterium]|nr:zf-HC2 domain-containing protein [Blastocatellia bacterium]